MWAEKAETSSLAQNVAPTKGDDAGDKGRRNKEHGWIGIPSKLHVKAQSKQEEGLTSGLGMEEGNRTEETGRAVKTELYTGTLCCQTEQSKPPAKKTTGQQANQQRMAEFTREEAQTRAQCRQPECSWPYDVTGRGDALTGDFLARKEERWV